MIYLNENFTLDRSIESNQFYYGYGCYMIIRGHGEKLFYIKEHLEKLSRDIKSIGLQKELSIEPIIYEYIKLEHLEDEDYLVEVVVSDQNFLVRIIKDIEINNKMKLGFIKKVPHNEIAYINSLNRLNDYLARGEVAEKKCDNGIFLNRSGEITNIINGNIFIIKNKKIYTAPKELNIYDGVIRQKVEEAAKKLKIELIEQAFCAETILQADAVFVTSIKISDLVVEVTQIEDKCYQSNGLVDKLKNNI